MRLSLVFLTVVSAALALSPHEEACAKPLMVRAENEPDAETKKFINQSFKLVTAGKREDVKSLVQTFDHAKFIKFLDEYMVDECSSFRAEFESMA